MDEVEPQILHVDESVPSQQGLKLSAASATEPVAVVAKSMSPFHHNKD